MSPHCVHVNDNDDYYSCLLLFSLLYCREMSEKKIVKRKINNNENERLSYVIYVLMHDRVMMII